MWASGIILYILLCGFPPFVSPDNEQEPLFDAILSGVYEFPEPYWNDIGQEVRDLIANMLQLGTIPNKHSYKILGIYARFERGRTFDRRSNYLFSSQYGECQVYANYT